MFEMRVMIPFVLAVASAVGGAFSYGGENPCLPLIFGVAAVLLLCIAAQARHRWAGMFLTGWSGFCVAMYLLVMKNDLKNSFCATTGSCDCNAVNLLDESMLFGMPVSALGAAFYAGVIALSLVAIRNRDPEKYPKSAHLIGLLSFISVIFSIRLGLVSMNEGKWCMLCVCLYGVNLLLFLNALALAKGSEHSFFRGGLTAMWGRGGKSGGVLWTTSLVVLIGSLSFFGKSEVSSDLDKLFEATAGALELDGTEPVFGSPSAPYIVVEFADFECGACGATYDPLHDLVEANPDIQLVFKHYPLSSLCNDAIQGARHQNSCAAAVAADCAGEQGKFWELARSMFKNQNFLDLNNIEIMAGQAHLDLQKFSACRDRISADAGVRADIEAARAVGVHHTPALFLKGIQGDEWVAMRGHVAGLEALVHAHRSGTTIPPTPEAKPHDH